MNLPVSVDDPSLREQEPLRSYIAMLGCTTGCRSSAKDTISAFVEEMQRDDQAAAAAKEWVCLLFQGVLSDECTLELTDGGEELFKVFLEYQHRVHAGGQDAAFKYGTHIYRRGIKAIKAIELKDHGGSTQHAQGRGQQSRMHSLHERHFPRLSVPKTACRPASSGLARALTMPAAAGSSLGRGSHSTSCGPTIQQGAIDPPPATSVRSSDPPGAAKISKRLSKKEKKRKASSQKPPVVTPSDASEDDKEPSQTHAATPASSTSHRLKRIAPNPCQSHVLIGVVNQADNIITADRAETNEQHLQGKTSISQTQLSLTSLRSGDFVFHPSIKGMHGALSDHKHDGRFFNVLIQPTRGDLNSRRLRKIKQARDPQPRPSKRLRRASMSTLDYALGEGFKSTLHLRAKFLQERTTRGPLASSSPPTRENVDSTARKKRSRLEFETAFMASDENASPSPHEVLGPDMRQFRPLPKKIRHVRSAQVVCAVPSGAPSTEHSDQLLRDAASNALAVLQEGAGPDLPDWTQDKEHDAEYDDLGGNGQDEVQATAAASVPPKPPVPAPPLIWAESRQEVCESFEYFRCYHSGVYSKDDIVKGYLLGAHSASRDVFHHDGKLIISHGGGKSESILETRRGPKRYQTDQDQEASDKSVRALLKTWKDRRPIVLLADDKYTLFPYDLTSSKYTYVVLGLYWISHAWAECQSARDGSGRVVRWKFAFQWCEGQGDPWWLSQMKDATSDRPASISSSLGMHPTRGSWRAANTGGDPSIQCDLCQHQSPFVYKQGWMCLNPHCDVFWSIDGEDPKQFDYREEFLSLLPQKFERLPNITPVRLMETPGGVTTTYACSKGWHCTNCGRLSCRYKWEHWECSNCKFTHVVNGRERSSKEFWHQRPSKGFLHSQIGKDSGILACRLEPINLGRGKGFTSRLTFILPHGRGKIHLILGTPLSNGDANDIFQLYQQQASTGELKLRRYPLRNHKARGLLLTNYFSQNSGEPYQYVGGSGQTVPFGEAPDCVQRALALIKERSSLALRTDIPFNEILSAAYMERQKMSFHSDSEKGLGPIVASLSLGSAALMHFRPHVNAENPKGKNPNSLTLVLRHGDVLVMDGDGVQKYYEHTVVPMNFRIAATARCIGSA